MRARPHHDTHGGSVINDNDQRADHQHDDTCNYYCPLGPDDEPADVTVSDLLDAYHGPLDAFLAIRNAATRDVIHSYFAIKSAVDHHHRLQHRLAALSPEERAEFDRRTT